MRLPVLIVLLIGQGVHRSYSSYSYSIDIPEDALTIEESTREGSKTAYNVPPPGEAPPSQKGGLVEEWTRQMWADLPETDNKHYDAHHPDNLVRAKDSK